MADASDVAISSEETQIIIKKEIESYKDILTNEGLPELQKKIHENNEKWKNTKLTIAVTGEMKAGKSSLINSIRDLTGDDEGAAKVGVTHTTKFISVYNHPHNGNFKFYDLPGIGAVGLGKDEYLKQIDFGKFDFFLIVSNKAFSQYDKELVEVLESLNKKFYFVRTCIDTTIKDDYRAHPKSHDKKTVLKTVRDECMENLKAIGINDPAIFLIDNYDKINEEYDFKNLEKRMIKDVDELKVEAMVFSLSALTLDHFQKKMNILRHRIPGKALEIASARNFDKQKEIFEKEIMFYQEQFNIDEKYLSSIRFNLIQLSDKTFNSFKIKFDQDKEERVFDIETPSERRSKIFVLRRFVDFFLSKISKEAGLLYRFSVDGLDKNLTLLHEKATCLHKERTLKGMAKQCF